MPAYWIAHVEVKDQDAYAQYLKRAPAIFERFGGEFLAKGGPSQVLEGTLHSRHVVIEFPNLQTALDCYNSAEYREARAFRHAAAEAEIVIVESSPG